MPFPMESPSSATLAPAERAHSPCPAVATLPDPRLDLNTGSGGNAVAAVVCAGAPSP